MERLLVDNNLRINEAIRSSEQSGICSSFRLCLFSLPHHGEGKTILTQRGYPNAKCGTAAMDEMGFLPVFNGVLRMITGQILQEKKSAFPQWMMAKSYYRKNASMPCVVPITSVNLRGTWVKISRSGPRI
ncbi:hypothetical protein [endosymbiont of Ridgeia piscesae]|jgi:hypothetical protein|uniref:Uncharacterized protein n=2 Tax=endosymbiont of Ridgeia piscesae TaxID=54398 RepID=A0A0T5ZBP2_9GAMM|nr:hypothetical protein [endosymbiont of Ridgeia piscesae]KRT60269.1 hypothetical protein Ga0076813_169037 [endosymbiont of Ridgeia piscesae]